MMRSSFLTCKPFYRLCLFPILILYVWTITTPVSSFLVHQNQNLETLPFLRTPWKAQGIQPKASGKSFISRQKHVYRKSQILPELRATLVQNSDYSSICLKGNMPIRGRDGIYDVLNEEQYRSLIQYGEEQNMLVVLKVFAPWCKACNKLGPKFVQLSRREEYEGIPILWAQLTCKDNKDLIQHVLVSLPEFSSLADAPYARKPKAAIPAVQLYDAGKEIFTFPCKPSNVPKLKEKLKHYFENEYEYPQVAAGNKVMGTGSNVADTAVVSWAPWTRTRLFPRGPVTVTTSELGWS